MMTRDTSMTVAVCALGAALTLLPRAADSALPTFHLDERLGHAWQAERVVYTLLSEQLATLTQAQFALVDATGRSLPYQVDRTASTITFVTDLAPFGTADYSFSEGTANTDTDLLVSESDDFIEVATAQFGVRLRRHPQPPEGPIRSWRLPSGDWAGDSRLEPTAELTDYRADVITPGPVLAHVRCAATFAGGGTWTLEVRLQAGEPLAEVQERFDCQPDGGTFRLRFTDNFPARHLLYRAGGSFDHLGSKRSLGAVILDSLTAEPDKSRTLFQLEPWLHWQNAKSRGTGFSLFGTAGDDLVFLATTHPATWVDPTIPGGQRASTLVPLVQGPEGSISLGFRLKRGQRGWLLGALSRDVVLSDLFAAAYVPTSSPAKPDAIAELVTALAEPELPDAMKGERDKLLRQATGADDPFFGPRHAAVYQAPLPQKYQIKYSDMPLDRVKDFVLSWSRKPRQHPRMLVTSDQLAAFRESYVPDQKKLASARSTPVSYYNLDDLIPVYLGTGDALLEQRLVAAAIDLVQSHASRQLDGSIVSVGVAPHAVQKRFATTLNLVDSILDSPQLEAPARERMLAQIAFIGYLLNRPDYWDAARGFGAMFINMHTTVAALRCTIAAVLPDHPLCQEWLNTGMSYMRRELLDRWADRDGHWLGTHVEAPHYAMASYDDVVGILVMAHNTGVSDELFGDTVKNMGAWFAKISTPPDARFRNWRHLPPIANTYKFEPSGIFGVLAGIYRQSDPTFAAEMQWMQQQHGDPTQPGVGGFSPALSGYRRVIGNSQLPAQPPDYKSEWFNESGLVLRDRYNTPAESMLYLIAGRGAVPQRHFDHDQGAVTIWGGGQIVSDDFGYCGCAPEEHQTMISSPAANGIMKVTEFHTGAVLDYASGIKGTWRRQILLVKGGDDLTVPSYVLIHDSFPKPTPALWRFWMSAEPVDHFGAKLLEAAPRSSGHDDGLELPDMEVEADGIGSLLTGGKSKASEPKAASILIGDRDILISGFSGMATDVVFAQLPPGAAIKHVSKTEKPAGMNGSGQYLAANPTTQIAAIIESAEFTSLLTMVRTRTATAPPPTVTALAEGRGLQIVHDRGKDIVFLAERPLQSVAAAVSFTGTVGLSRTLDGQRSDYRIDP